jgi:uncharacterized protein (TIGR03437 family)
MHRLFRLLPLGLLLLGTGYAREVQGACGAYRERFQEDLQLHRKVLRLRRDLLLRAQPAQSTPRSDAGDIAVIEDADGVVARRDDFNLDRQTLTFTPSDALATRYRVAVAGASYDAAAATSGAPIAGFGDDDTRQFALPFSFPFFGAAYQRIFVNSDGNLTFVSGDSASIERSLGRLTAGPPRIAPLFEDLDPSRSLNGVTVLSDASRFVVSWVSVPEYSQWGAGVPQTFQVRLYPNGRIEFAYAGVLTTAAIVGIAPGGLQGSPSVVSFLDSATQQEEFSAAVAERFGTDLELDLLTAVQKFYENHEDSYDYLVVFNNLGIPDSPSSLASERTVRTHWTGNGDQPVDLGAWFGSASRLESVINMGPLSQYPSDLNAPMPQRPEDTSITILAHEAGHLFLAYASIPNPIAPDSPPMLGGQNAHWSFNFNSDASLLEGNRIQDNGAGASPRFLTTGSAQHYSPLDQYLMGFRAAEDVPPFHQLFFVPNSPYPRTRLPQTGVGLNGDRRDVPIAELIAAVGRRTPDYTMAQRRFRVGFMLVLSQGAQPSDAELAKLNRFRTMFEAYYQKATACDNCQFPSLPPSVDTTLRRALRLSIFPMAGVLRNGSIPVTVSVLTAPQAGLSVSLSALNGLVSGPPAVVIPAGATSASFSLTGVKPGVEDLVATPADASYETVYSRLQVAGGAAGLLLTLVSGGNQVASPGVPLAQPVVFRVTDINNLSFLGVPVQVSVTGGGSVTPSAAVTDSTGSVSFQWTPGANPPNHLTATVDGGPSLTVPALGRPAFTQAGVVNAASYSHDIGAGSIVALFGANLWAGIDADAPGLPWPTELAGVRVLLNGQPAQLTAVREGQINFVVPSGLAPGTATVAVSNGVSDSAPLEVPIAAVAPAIFMDPATNFGAIQVAWSGQWTNVHPAKPGDYVEIYATGLGPVHLSSAGLEETDQPVEVFLGSQQIVDVPYSGLVPGYVGLYQINARIPAGAPAGVGTLSIEIGGQRSNVVNIKVQ